MLRPEVIHMRAIHACGKKLGLDHTRLSEIVQEPEMYGKRLSEMSEIELRQFRTWLEGKARKVAEKPAAKPAPAKPVWDKQDKRIFKMGFVLGWNNKDLRGFFMRTVKKYDLRKLTAPEKSAVINGLQKVIDGKHIESKRT
ncbi:MAG: hypothetical protein M0R74_13995 [Dehalococcoidia bacterium]|nr:hypothetical protein [Dehalococcoidia bacterium]